MAKSVAIVGLGAWGVCVLERLTHALRGTRRPVTVHLVQPGHAAGGIYRPDDPDYLILNNPCGQISLYACPEPGEPPPYALGLFDWAIARGYRWQGEACVVGGRGRALRATDYLPRRVMAEYLSWFSDSLVASMPRCVEVVRHDAEVQDCERSADGRERLLLTDQEALVVDAVFLTTGHTANVEPPGRAGAVREIRPYPLDHLDALAAPGEPLGVSGMGLVAHDVVAALTVGRGGRFAEHGPSLRYVPSGAEPVVYLYSRTGMPSVAKPAQSSDPTGAYDPVLCTESVVQSLRFAGNGKRRQVDFRVELLPFLLSEMKARYLIHAAYLAGGDRLSQQVRAALAAGASAGAFERAAGGYEPRLGRYDPVNHFFPGLGRSWVSGKDYETSICELVMDDSDQALVSDESPMKAAQEVTRILRDAIRAVVEFRGLSLTSYRDFQATVRSRLNRLDAGPPVERSRQLLALVEAGVVRAPFGPNPSLRRTHRGVAIRSSALDQPEEVRVRSVVRGHLEQPTVARSASPLIRGLYARGRLRELCYGETTVGSVAIDEKLHPIDHAGRVQGSIFLLGVLTEGARYFTQYIPSPKSRLRAVLDAQRAVEEVLGD